MQKPLEIPISLGNLRGTLIGAGVYMEDCPLGDLYPQQHNHTYYELHCVLQGSCTLQTNQKSYQIEPNHILIIPPEIYHHFKSAEKGLQKIDLAFELELPPGSGVKAARMVLDAFPKNDCLDLDLRTESCGLLRDAILFIGDILREERQYSFLGREQLRAMSNVVLVELYAALSGCAEEQKEQPDVVDSRVHRIESFIARHYNDKDTCEDLAELLHVSQRQLTRIIRQLYNMSFREKVNEMRLQNAMDLLVTTNLTIAEIADRLGYSSPSNFSIFIKKQTGQTPTAIRLSAGKLTGAR